VASATVATGMGTPYGATSSRNLPLLLERNGIAAAILHGETIAPTVADMMMTIIIYNRRMTVSDIIIFLFFIIVLRFYPSSIHPSIGIHDMGGMAPSLGLGDSGFKAIHKTTGETNDDGNVSSIFVVIDEVLLATIRERIIRQVDERPENIAGIHKTVFAVLELGKPYVGSTKLNSEIEHEDCLIIRINATNNEIGVYPYGNIEPLEHGDGFSESPETDRGSNDIEVSLFGEVMKRDVDTVDIWGHLLRLFGSEEGSIRGYVNLLPERLDTFEIWNKVRRNERLTTKNEDIIHLRVFGRGYEFLHGSLLRTMPAALDAERATSVAFIGELDIETFAVPSSARIVLVGLHLVLLTTVFW